MLFVVYAKVPQRCTFFFLSESVEPTVFAKFIKVTLSSYSVLSVFELLDLKRCMQEWVCMCVTNFLIKNVCIWGFLLLLRHMETVIYHGAIGNHDVNNGDFFVSTAFIYSSKSC